MMAQGETDSPSPFTEAAQQVCTFQFFDLSSVKMSEMCTVRLMVVLTFFFFAECAAGSCLSYGHSCWGAHGKRSGSPSHIDNNRLLFARLFRPNINENDKQAKEFDNTAALVEIKQIMNDGDLETNPLKGLNDYDSPVDILFDDPISSYEDIPSRRIKSTNRKGILKKRST